MLASASPRRRELLAALGVEFEVEVSGAEELSGGEPGEIVVENAVRKARAVAERRPGAWVLGADTDVVVDGETLGKAADPDGAERRLRALSGRTHEVLGGWAIVEPQGSLRSGLERTTVVFRPLGESEIAAYLASGEWRDRAGAYAVQGLGSTLIERIEGDVANVIGLPVRGLLAGVPELFAFDSVS